MYFAGIPPTKPLKHLSSRCPFVSLVVDIHCLTSRCRQVTLCSRSCPLLSLVFVLLLRVSVVSASRWSALKLASLSLCFYTLFFFTLLPFPIHCFGGSLPPCTQCILSFNLKIYIFLSLLAVWTFRLDLLTWATIFLAQSSMPVYAGGLPGMFSTSWIRT